MNANEQAIFLDAMGEVAEFARSAQAAAARAQSQCHAEVYEQLDVIAKRLYELRIRAEWLQKAVVHGWPLEDASLQRMGPDRRQGIDRRVETMKKQLRGDLARVKL
jgi:hypothetical protein